VRGFPKDARLVAWIGGAGALSPSHVPLNGTAGAECQGRALVQKSDCRRGQVAWGAVRQCAGTGSEPARHGQNHALARSLSDAGIGMAVWMLEEKADKYRKQVVRIERFFPSSKMCSCCGYVVLVLPLQIREWKCAMCDAVHDRNRNAANDILAVEQTVTAQGDRLRDAQPMDCESSCR
jgi:transposase